MPGLAEQLCFTVAATGSYEAAAGGSKWGVPVDDSKLRVLGQRIGAQAEGQARERLATPAQEREPQRTATPLDVLMVDGWQVRQRGEGWGKRKTSKSRVEWHELKFEFSCPTL